MSYTYTVKVDDGPVLLLPWTGAVHDWLATRIRECPEDPFAGVQVMELDIDTGGLKPISVELLSYPERVYQDKRPHRLAEVRLRCTGWEQPMINWPLIIWLDTEEATS